MEITHDTPGRYCDLVGVPEESVLAPGQDFRLPQYRREVFLRFYEFHLRHRAHPGMVYLLLPYLRDHYQMDKEQALWFAFINGNTQNPVTSWLIHNQFPELPSGLAATTLEMWFNENYERLEFDTDRRYHKKEFLKSVQCYRNHMLNSPGGNQYSFFAGSLGLENQYENFQRLWRVVYRDFHSFGRLSTFSYLEYLRIMGVNLDCDQLFLEDMDGSKSHRNGLAKVLGRDDLDWHSSNPTGFEGKYTKEVLSWLKKEGALLLQEMKDRAEGQPWEKDVSYFTLESTFCTFKSWFRKNRRYPGVYVDMLHDRIKKAEKKWPEVSFSIFWAARHDELPLYLCQERTGDLGVHPTKQNHFRETGQVITMGYEWPCFANYYDKTL